MAVIVEVAGYHPLTQELVDGLADMCRVCEGVPVTAADVAELSALLRTAWTTGDLQSVAGALEAFARYEQGLTAESLRDNQSWLWEQQANRPDAVFPRWTLAVINRSL